jgi:hypothetical protein
MTGIILSTDAPAGAQSLAFEDASLLWTCGCVTGQRLCPEAVRLWMELGSAYARAQSGQGYDGYEAACRDFDAHYRSQEAA